ncbi:MAG: transcriptional regulator NrdR, partial [Candidatus Gracilibacteria bacterium]
MKCPKCKFHDTSVIDSRETQEGKSIRRRRECEKCKYRFTTFEKIEATSFIIIKKDNSREPYNREKLERGIWRACEKRPVTHEQIQSLLNDLEEEWAGIGKEVPSKT